MAENPADLQRTPLHERHIALGARMVPFAGYAMPVQYRLGVLGEHVWTREHAGLFDVSHMGQGALDGPDHDTSARALERLIPSDVVNLKPGQQRYSVLLSDEGGIRDDLMVARSADPRDDGALFLVVNAANKAEDWEHIAGRLPENVRLVPRDDRALLALQGPEAEAVLLRHVPDIAGLGFMQVVNAELKGIPVQISRPGYTGEDGFEISVPAEYAVAVWDALLDEPEVEAIGLGARDSLRLEAGLCLHGHDIDATTDPIEADIAWVIQKRRREEGGFPGEARIRAALADGPSRKRVGIKPEGRAPAREGTLVTDEAGTEIGHITSGGFGPSVEGPVAMGYVRSDLAAPGTPLNLVVRGEPRPARVVALPFAPHRYKR